MVRKPLFASFRTKCGVDLSKIFPYNDQNGIGFIMDKAFVQAFIESFTENLPPALSGLHDIVQEHARQTAERVLDNMGVVSREEFDVQVMMLKKARERLDKLEKLLKK